MLAALNHGHGVVLGQVDVEAKTNEIPMFATLPDHVGLTGAVVTADALHAQRAHAEYLAGQRGAHYLITVKRNQPGLRLPSSPAYPWRQVPVAHDAREKGHGRAERRTVKITAVAAGLAFPHAAQAIQIVRRRRPLNSKKRTAETVYAITSLTATQARPAELAAGHHPRPLVNRRPAALGPRCRLRRGPLPGPHRQRPPRHGQPAQPGHRHPVD